MTPTLHELWSIFENHSDKGNADHAFAGQSYLSPYERYFESHRESVHRLLEIGVCGGFSIRLWRDYFPNAEIHGLDIDPAAKEATGERIVIHIGDQSSPAVLEGLSAFAPFDIIIDDGSHCTEHILASFKALWPHVAPGGFYVWEDMRLSYNDVDGGWPGMTYNRNLPPNRRSDIEVELLSRIRALDHFEGDIRAIHIHSMIYFIEKV